MGKPTILRYQSRCAAKKRPEDAGRGASDLAFERQP